MCNYFFLIREFLFRIVSIWSIFEKLFFIKSKSLLKTYLTSPLFYCMIGTVVPKRLFVLYRNICSLSSGFRKNDMMLVTQTGIQSPTPHSYGKLSLSYTFIMFGFQTSLISLSLWWKIHILQEIGITTQRHQSKNGG